MDFNIQPVFSEPICSPYIFLSCLFVILLVLFECSANFSISVIDFFQVVNAVILGVAGRGIIEVATYMVNTDTIVNQDIGDIALLSIIVIAVIIGIIILSRRKRSIQDTFTGDVLRWLGNRLSSLERTIEAEGEKTRKEIKRLSENKKGNNKKDKR
jgi:hypothetical protein